MQDDYDVEESTDHDYTGLWGFGFNLFDKEDNGVGGEGSSKFTYLLMLIQICPGDWKTQVKRMNQVLDEKNVK